VGVTIVADPSCLQIEVATCHRFVMSVGNLDCHSEVVMTLAAYLLPGFATFAMDRFSEGGGLCSCGHRAAGGDNRGERCCEGVGNHPLTCVDGGATLTSLRGMRRLAFAPGQTGGER